jgi:signal transduction histidine kinase
MTFLADGDRLKQLLTNPFRNAIEHGGSDVTIHVGALADVSGLHVSDNGTGIPEEERSEVLVHGYLTAEKGTGFGLVIVKKIAEAHEWDMRVMDSADEEARFEVTGRVRGVIEIYSKSNTQSTIY